MKRQSGFALFQVLLIAALVGGFVYSMMISENAEQSKSRADQLAVVLTPATHAFFKYGLLNGANTYYGNAFYGTNYIISSSYEQSLSDGGYDYDSDKTILTYAVGEAASKTVVAPDYGSGPIVECAALIPTSSSGCALIYDQNTCLNAVDPYNNTCAWFTYAAPSYFCGSGLNKCSS